MSAKREFKRKQTPAAAPAPAAAALLPVDVEGSADESLAALQRSELAKAREQARSARQQAEDAEQRLQQEIADKKVFNLPVEAIAYHENNDYREFECDEESIRQLAEAIRQNGFLGSRVVCEREGGVDIEGQPAVGTRYVLLSGERRLRAVTMLRAENAADRARFATLPCVIKGEFSREKTIRDAEEMVILDEANLQTRGGLMAIGNHQFITKVTNRYIENLQIAYGLTKKQAMQRLNENTNGNNLKTIYRNLQLKSGLIPALYEMSVAEEYGEISKFAFLAYTGYTPEEQQVLADAFALAVHRFAEDAKIRQKVLKDMVARSRALIENDSPLDDTKLEELRRKARLEALREFCVVPEPAEKKPRPVVAEQGKTFVKYRSWTGKLDKVTKEFEKVCASNTKLKNLREMNEQAIQQGEASLLEEIDALIVRLQVIRNKMDE